MLSGQELDYDVSQFSRVLPDAGTYQRGCFRKKQEIMHRVKLHLQDALMWQE